MPKFMFVSKAGKALWNAVCRIVLRVCQNIDWGRLGRHLGVYWNDVKRNFRRSGWNRETVDRCAMDFVKNFAHSFSDSVDWNGVTNVFRTSTERGFSFPSRAPALF